MRILSFGLAATAAALLSCNAIAAAAAWHVETLPDSVLAKFSGCQETFSATGAHAADTLFYNDGTGTAGAPGVIKIAGKVYDLKLLSAKTNGKADLDASGPGTKYDQIYRDKTGAVVVTTSVKVTKENPEADSTEMAGSMTVTFGGTTQKIAIEGGVAC
jgi:hypothetical protein